MNKVTIRNFAVCLIVIFVFLALNALVHESVFERSFSCISKAPRKTKTTDTIATRSKVSEKNSGIQTWSVRKLVQNEENGRNIEGAEKTEAHVYLSSPSYEEGAEFSIEKKSSQNISGNSLIYSKNSANFSSEDSYERDAIVKNAVWPFCWFGGKEKEESVKKGRVVRISMPASEPGFSEMVAVRSSRRTAAEAAAGSSASLGMERKESISEEGTEGGTRADSSLSQVEVEVRVHQGVKLPQGLYSVPWRKEESETELEYAEAEGVKPSEGEIAQTREGEARNEDTAAEIETAEPRDEALARTETEAEVREIPQSGDSEEQILENQDAVGNSESVLADSDMEPQMRLFPEVEDEEEGPSFSSGMESAGTASPGMEDGDFSGFSEGAGSDINIAESDININDSTLGNLQREISEIMGESTPESNGLRNMEGESSVLESEAENGSDSSGIWAGNFPISPGDAMEAPLMEVPTAGHFGLPAPVSMPNVPMKEEGVPDVLVIEDVSDLEESGPAIDLFDIPADED